MQMITENAVEIMYKEAKKMINESESSNSTGSIDVDMSEKSPMTSAKNRQKKEKKGRSIRNILLFFFVVMVISPLILVGTIVYYQNVNQNLESFREQLHSAQSD